MLRQHPVAILLPPSQFSAGKQGSQETKVGGATIDKAGRSALPCIAWRNERKRGLLCASFTAPASHQRRFQLANKALL